MLSSAPRQVFQVRPTPLGWDIVCREDDLEFKSPGLYQTERAAEAEAARLDVLYAC